MRIAISQLRTIIREEARRLGGSRRLRTEARRLTEGVESSLVRVQGILAGVMHDLRRSSPAIAADIDAAGRIVGRVHSQLEHDGVSEGQLREGAVINDLAEVQKLLSAAASELRTVSPQLVAELESAKRIIDRAKKRLDQAVSY